MGTEGIVKSFMRALNMLFDDLEALEKATERLEVLDPIYANIVSEIRTELETLWSAGDRLFRKVERLKD